VGSTDPAVTSSAQPSPLDEDRRRYERAAEADDTDAMVKLGGLLADQLEPPYLTEARRWYERAADAGNTDALFLLGLGYDYGLRGWPGDLTEARRWYERAAEAGNEDAMFGLGRLLALKLDPPDLPNARLWLELAVAAGDRSGPGLIPPASQVLKKVKQMEVAASLKGCGRKK
jgi:TPR repeat protein